MTDTSSGKWPVCAAPLTLGRHTVPCGVGSSDSHRLAAHRVKVRSTMINVSCFQATKQQMYNLLTTATMSRTLDRMSIWSTVTNIWQLYEENAVQWLIPTWKHDAVCPTVTASHILSATQSHWNCCFKVLAKTFLTAWYWHNDIDICACMVLAHKGEFTNDGIYK